MSTFVYRDYKKRKRERRKARQMARKVTGKAVETVVKAAAVESKNDIASK